MPVGEWQWTVPSGHRIRAAIDEAGTESVWIGQKLVSRSLAGSKADHRGTLDAGNGDNSSYRQDAKPVHQMRVTFDQAEATCQLLFDGAPVAPTSSRAPRPPPTAGVVERGPYVPGGAAQGDGGAPATRVVVAVAMLCAIAGVGGVVLFSRLGKGGSSDGGAVALSMGRELTAASPNGMVSVSYHKELAEHASIPPRIRPARP